MLPVPTGTSRSSGIPEYFKRMFNYTQMDLEYTFYQMFYLCVAPARAYRTTKHHKRTKERSFYVSFSLSLSSLSLLNS